MITLLLMWLASCIILKCKQTPSHFGKMWITEPALWDQFPGSPVLGWYLIQAPGVLVPVAPSGFTHTLRHTHTPAHCGTNFQWAIPSLPPSAPLFSLCHQCFYSDPSIALILRSPFLLPAWRIVHTPSALTVNAVLAREMRLKQTKKKEEKPGSLPPYVPCSNPLLPSLLPSSHPHFL